MTNGPGSSEPEPTQPYGSAPDPVSLSKSDPPPPPPPPPTGPPTQTMGYGAPVAGYGAPILATGYGVGPQTPYGIHPSGVPYSDKQKLVAGLLQIFLGGFGVGRFYIGDNKTAIWQIVVTFVTCGFGSLWGLIDGIIMLTSDTTKDSRGYILRPN